MKMIMIKMIIMIINIITKLIMVYEELIMIIKKIESSRILLRSALEMPRLRPISLVTCLSGHWMQTADTIFTDGYT